MNIEDFNLLANYLKQRSGLVLSQDKAYLLETRLMPVARKHGLKDLDELAQKVRTQKPEALLSDITEAMTTNESLFFRDTKPFELFKKNVLPGLMETRAATKRIRIWSAACSSGQEPYSLAMMLKDQAAKMAGWRIEIIATDISPEMVNKAKAGLYTQFEVQRGLPITMLVKNFKQVGDKWQLDSSIRSMVQFREFNLLSSPASLGQFDVVYCRNVLIYFDQPTKKTVLEAVSKQMPSDGLLFLGGAETVLGVSDAFKPVSGHRGMYQKAAGNPNIKA
jgi:chemotaxis protein methyltransferase CheR